MCSIWTNTKISKAFCLLTDILSSASEYETAQHFRDGLVHSNIKDRPDVSIQRDADLRNA